MRKRSAGMYVDQVTGNGKELLGFVVTFTHTNHFLGAKNHRKLDRQEKLRTWV
jgi:hypothetical protein